jgi:hypothetical protein
VFEPAIIPGTVFVELQHPNTPPLVQEWDEIFAGLLKGALHRRCTD